MGQAADNRGGHLPRIQGRTHGSVRGDPGQRLRGGRGMVRAALRLAPNVPRPHLAAVGAIWIDDKFYFVSGPRLRKSRNLAVNPRCAVSVSLDDIDVVVEGTARKVSDASTLERVANQYASLGWPARASEGAITAEYSAPSAGRGPWDLYAVTPTAAVGVATKEPHGATRWRFDS